MTFQDISQRVRAEEEIRRLNADLERRVAERTAEVQAKERFLRMITDAAPGILGYWDADLRNRFANRRYLEWFGITPEWVEGRRMAEVLSPEVIAAIEPHVRAVLRGEPQRFERPDHQTRRHGRLRLDPICPGHCRRRGSRLRRRGLRHHRLQAGAGRIGQTGEGVRRPLQQRALRLPFARPAMGRSSGSTTPNSPGLGSRARTSSARGAFPSS